MLCVSLSVIRLDRIGIAMQCSETTRLTDGVGVRWKTEHVGAAGRMGKATYNIQRCNIQHTPVMQHATTRTAFALNTNRCGAIVCQSTARGPHYTRADHRRPTVESTPRDSAGGHRWRFSVSPTVCACALERGRDSHVALGRAERKHERRRHARRHLIPAVAATYG